MRRHIFFAVALTFVLVLSWSLSSPSAQTVPGATVEERAINGAKAYLKKSARTP